MKKICHITTVHSLFDTRIFHKEAKTLASFGYDITLIVQHDKKETVEGIKIIPLPKTKNRLKRFFRINQLAYNLALKQKADIYHFHDPELIPWMVKLKKKTGAKIIYDVHEDVPRQILGKHYIPKRFRRIVARIVEIIENCLIKKIDVTISATPFIRDRFLKLGCNVVNVRNFPLLSEFKDISQDWKYKERAVCYVGGIDEIRGLYEIIKATEKTDIKLILAGNFIAKEQKSRAVKMRGWRNVEYVGYANRKEIKEIFLRAIAGLVVLRPLVNYVDSLPVKLFEYMAAGLPVIASNFQLWEDIVEGNNCGICVDPLEPKKITEGIEYLMEHPIGAKKMGENGRRAVLEKYNWENESKKLLKIYKELLG
jgi:glycosyltransferase involved in cell wall biosynthesis